MTDEDKIAFLQLQRSALIDTQTIFQLLVEKGTCNVDEVTATRQKVEMNDGSVKQIDAEIARLRGEEIDIDFNDVITKLRNILGKDR